MINIEEEIKNGLQAIASLKHVVAHELIGSAAYLPEQAQDVDFAVLIHNLLDPLKYVDALHESGWGKCSDYDTSTAACWSAVHNGNLNFMITSSPDFFANYVKAMEVCKALKLTEKADRIAVCQIVRDGKKAHEVSTGYRREQVTAKAGFWDTLMEMCGSFQDGSEAVVHLTQDDATRTCIIKINPHLPAPRQRSYFVDGGSFESAVTAYREEL